MKAVGVKQLKARLSEYLRVVKAGETVLVTERDDIVAELRPARGKLPAVDDVEETLELLAAAGEITRATQPKRGFRWRSRGLGLPAGTAADMLGDLRAEREGPEGAK